MVFVILYFGAKVMSKWWSIAMGLALGGVLGNLADRIFRPPYRLQGEVIDFLQLPNWPIFNVADMAVVSSAVLIAILSFKNIPYNKTS
jgi:signal peptidase II